MGLKLSDNYYYDVIRKNIKKFRKEKGFTQIRLAEEAELSPDYICEIESLKKQKSFSIAEETELSPDYICEIESQKKQKSFSIATLGRISEALNVEITRFFEE